MVNGESGDDIYEYNEDMFGFDHLTNAQKLWNAVNGSQEMWIKQNAAVAQKQYLLETGSVCARLLLLAMSYVVYFYFLLEVEARGSLVSSASLITKVQ